MIISKTDDHIKLIGTFVTIITAIVCATWCVATIDKRVALVEQQESQITQRLDNLDAKLDRVYDMIAAGKGQ